MMTKHVSHAVAAAALLAAVSIPAQARAQVVCADRRLVTDHLATNYDEHAAGTGLTFAGQAIELYVAESGSWTIVVTGPDGESCIVSHGEAWQTRPRTPRRGARWPS